MKYFNATLTKLTLIQSLLERNFLSRGNIMEQIQYNEINERLNESNKEDEAKQGVTEKAAAEAAKKVTEQEATEKAEDRKKRTEEAIRYIKKQGKILSTPNINKQQPSEQQPAEQNPEQKNISLFTVIINFVRSIPSRIKSFFSLSEKKPSKYTEDDLLMYQLGNNDEPNDPEIEKELKKRGNKNKAESPINRIKELSKEIMNKNYKETEKSKETTHVRQVNNKKNPGAVNILTGR